VVPDGCRNGMLVDYIWIGRAVAGLCAVWWPLLMVGGGCGR
jgi:hypothetical protein